MNSISMVVNGDIYIYKYMVVWNEIYIILMVYIVLMIDSDKCFPASW